MKCLIDELGKDFVGIKIRCGELASGLRMPRIVRFNRLDRCHCLLHRPEREQPLTYREDGAETGILDGYRPASRQIAGRTARGNA